MGPISGHDTSNDDLFGTGAGANGDQGGFEKGTPNAQWGGSNTDPGMHNFTQAEIDHPGAQRSSPFYGNVSGYTQELINRNQARGDAAAGRAAYQQDFGDYGAAMSQANYDRGSQQRALNLQRDAALGNAPSRAEILGRQMADQGIASQMAMGASARGGALAQAAALRNAQGGQAAYMQNATNSIAALRAQEMAQARGDYMQGATGMRQQDYMGASAGLQKTGLQTQNELGQRQLNQQEQEFYENAANGIYSQQLGADSQGASLGAQKQQFQDARDDSWLKLGIGTGGGIAGAALTSDSRAKQAMHPLLSKPSATPRSASLSEALSGLDKLRTKMGAR